MIYSVYISLCLKDNIVPILIDFLKKYYKYNYIFFFNRSNFLIQERFYASSNIKDKIFHSYNGKLSCLLQKNLFQANGPGMFATSDVIFTLGKKSLPNLKRFDCKIKKIFAVGSLFMENSYFNHPNYQKKNKKIFNFDILVFASSHTSRFHSGYDTYYDEYYEHFNWIKKIALKYPNIKIGIKHKKDFNDKKEIQILKNIKNIFYIVDKSKFYSDSYLLAKNSKILVTWSSTLGYELISLNKNCYYLDPKNSNFAFLPPSKLNNKIRLTKFEEFENILKKMLQKKYIKKVKNKDDYCLSSKKTSEAIIKYLEKETTK